MRKTCLVELAGAAMLLVATALPVAAETLKDWKCTGNSDIPWDEQIAGCTKAIASEKFAGPGTVGALYNRGLAYQNKGDAKNALADYTQAITLDPKFPLAYGNRGNVYQAGGDYDRAIADYDRAIALNPKYV